MYYILTIHIYVSRFECDFLITCTIFQTILQTSFTMAVCVLQAGPHLAPTEVPIILQTVFPRWPAHTYNGTRKTELTDSLLSHKLRGPVGEKS